MVEANQGWSRRRREGTSPHLISSCHHSRPPPLALIKVDIIIIANTHNVSKLFAFVLINFPENCDYIMLGNNGVSCAWDVGALLHVLLLRFVSVCTVDL